MWKTWRPGQGAAGERGPGGIPSNAGPSAGPVMCACSACAGEYEDPDRTACTPSELDKAERDPAFNGETEEFPANE